MVNSIMLLKRKLLDYGQSIIRRGKELFKVIKGLDNGHIECIWYPMGQESLSAGPAGRT